MLQLEQLYVCTAVKDIGRHLAMVRARGRDGDLEGATSAFKRL